MCFNPNKRLLPASLALLLLLVPVLALGTSYKVSAWTFGDRDSLAAAVTRGAIDEVNVDWYLSLANAGLRASWPDMDYVTLAHSEGLKVLATVSNYSDALGDFDSHLAHVLLNTPKLRDRHVTAIWRMCVNQGYDGIDLDWESVLRADRSKFTQFVRALGTKLHQHHKLLSIAVSAKTSEPGDWFGAQSEDYAKLGAVVDEFKVMTYDYSGSWSDPGPISPPSWTNDVLTFAESVVPSAKIMMGVPFYGYDWHNGTTDSLTWTDAQSIIATYSPAITRDVSGEATFTYTDGSGNAHTVFYQDDIAIQTKLDMLLTLHPSIRGIAIWVMGGESTGFWDAIEAKLKSGSGSARSRLVGRGSRPIPPREPGSPRS